MKYIVYLTENTKCQVNGLNRIYIGVHGTEDPYIFDGYIGCGVKINQPCTYMYPKTPFQKAVKKFGTAAFKRTTLFIYDSLEEAYLKEHEIVTEEFILQPHTYNVSLGGQYEQRWKPLYQFDISGNLVKAWASSKDAYDFYGLPGYKFDSAKRGRILFMGYFWSTSPSISLEDYSLKPNKKVIYLYLKSGKLYKEFSSLRECSDFLKMNTGSVHQSIQRSSLIKDQYYVSYRLVDLFIPKPRTVYVNKDYYVYYKTGEFLGHYVGKDLMDVIHLKSWNKIGQIFETGHNWYKDYYITFEPVEKVPNKKYLNGISVDVYDKYGNYLETLPTIQEVKKKYNVPAGKIKNIQCGNKYYGDYIFKCNSK